MVAAVPSHSMAPSLIANAWHGATLDQVREDVAVRSSHALPDVTVPLRALHVTPAGLFEVPGVGEFDLTDWSRSQLSRLLGIRWDRWFGGGLVSPEERKEEIERRLTRLSGEWKIRTRHYFPGEEGPGDGVVRAFLGAGYTPIDDVRVLDRLARVVRSRVEAFRILRQDITDRSSYYVAVTMDEVDLGDHKADPHWNGFVIANSEVGFGALSLLEYLVRLVCANGLVVFGHGHKLFHRVHRSTTDDSLDRDLSYAFTRLPDCWSETTRAIRTSQTDVIEDPEVFLAQLLGHPLLRPHADAIRAVLNLEPVPTRFSAVQILTQTAQSLPPDERYQLERLAGRVLVGAEA
ncbi:MAG: hypothetical protein UT86_C0001G0242 [Candidatus Magasanikbacteria bacterium GW2011_GWC2_40_17]|uniref:Uncharacterized protein n=1 Tax=Candidatus Magasanikbacteria bacterium GW2011_GWA2_42_32 TaxID=1619039 RepID=A0A0G1A9B0_9BACT|nr:MAG: hypothetical protein UT86_C0001G0242 [Candidatus Magasanikbacteria bacterium GW2011_GWC2_40_17]KKS57602.1 MAG: hypothetical protein UV20_C0001G0242 [Candidatus Magasanikbacteria bacterium GW2011_GWA2_42_32]